MNIVWHSHEIDKRARADKLGQRPCVLWFTGLSGAGKSTIAGKVEERLFAENAHSYLLDGDNVRHGLCGDLGFADADREENIRRVGEVGKLMVDAGLIVLTAFISPFQRDRQKVRDMLEAGEFLEVFVDAPLDVCEGRDPKGLYKKARAGDIPNFTGIDSDYEAPEDPEIHLNTAESDADQCAEQVIEYLRRNGYLEGDWKLEAGS